VNFFENRNRTLYAGGKINFVTGNTAPLRSKNTESQHDGSIREVDFVPVVIAKREVYANIGLWDTEYKLLFDETDFCLRAKKQGYKVVFVPDSIVWHKVGPAGLGGSEKRIYFLFRNRIRFIIKNFPVHYLITALSYTVLQIFGLTIFFSIKGKTSHVKILIAATAWNIRNMRKTIIARESSKPTAWSVQE
jgi:GT2 family glycosyltransferase